MNRWFAALGALGVGLAVALGAYGSHGLTHFADAHGLLVWQKAVQYQFIHCLGLLLLAALADKICSKAYYFSSLLMIFGTLVFSGSLYIMVLLELPKIGMITPVGGVSFLIAWALFCVGIIRGKQTESCSK